MIKDFKNCSHKNTTIIERQETYVVKGEKITVDAKIKKCEICNQEFFDVNLDTENLKNAYKKYKEQHNLMQAEEIVALRKKFNLTQNMLAVLVGCTQATIARYEKGSIQSETHNTALELLKNFDNIRKIFEIKKADFSIGERKILEKVLCGEKFDVNAMSINLLENVYNYSPSIYSGFKKFDMQKFMAAILFFALNQADLYKTKLMKLLWYTDMLYFKKNAVSMTGMKYIHQKYGPVPERHSLCLSVMEELGIIELQEQEYGEVVVPKFDKTLIENLSKSEIEILKSVNSRFLYTKAKDISELSHQEKGYRDTDFLELISYEYAFEMN